MTKQFRKEYYMVNNLWVVFIVGILIGMVIATVIYASCKTAGVLKIDHTSSDKDIYRIEINDLSKLDHESRIILKIDHDADLSH